MKNFLSIILLCLVVLSCNKPKDSFVGPEYSTVSSDFRVEAAFSADKASVNFQSENQFFSAQFSERASWSMRLEGEESKAVKEIKGLSSVIDASNSAWNGSHDGLKFFKSEKVIATLTLLGSDKEYQTVFNIAGVKNSPEAVKLGNGFEDFIPYTYEYAYSPFNDGDELSFFDITKEEVIHGDYAFKLAGIDVNKNYYLGLVRRRFSQNRLVSPPSEVWFNVYVFGNGDKTSKLKIAGKEDENGNNIYDDADKEDSWEFEIPLDHKGWKLVSVKYSDFVRSTEKGFGDSGNGIREPSKIAAVDFALLTSLPGSYAEAIFDYPTITEKQPFKP